jgi:hypothetical protein
VGAAPLDTSTVPADVGTRLSSSPPPTVRGRTDSSNRLRRSQDPGSVDCACLPDRVRQKSMRMTARRNVGRLTSVKPASANTLTVPTCSSSLIAFVVVIG